MYYTQAELYAGSTYGIVGYSKKGKPRYGHTPLDPGKAEMSRKFYHPDPKPEPPKPPTLAKATQASVGQGPRQAKGSKRRTRLSDLRIARPKVNTQLAIGAGGTGLNVGGYA